MIIYGFNAVRESVKSDKIKVLKVYFSTKKLGFEVRGIPVIKRDREFLSRIAKSHEHQGIVAEIEEFPYKDLKTLLNEQNNELNLVMLDRVNDPHNLGAAIRVCECAGIDGIIIGEKFGAKISPAVFKVSAGAAAYLPVILVENPIDSVMMLKDRGLSIFSIENTDISVSFDSTGESLSKGNLFVFGSEGEGIASSILDKSDKVFTIPMKGKVNSLNLSTSVSAFLFKLGI